MKFLATFAYLAFATKCLSAPTTGDQYAELIKDVLAYAKQLMTEYDPLPLPDIQGEKIKDENVDLTISQTHTLLSKASTFTVEKVATDPNKLSASVKVNIPELVQSGQYVAAGVAYGKTVSGQGDITVHITNFDQTIEAVFINPDTSLQISQLNLDYNVDDIQIEMNGLKIEGMTDEQVKAFINNVIVNKIKQDKQKVEVVTAQILQDKLNALMKGLTLDEVVEWVKQQIHQ